MNAFILAAGLGTRLRPWTLAHPKALVPVGGIPMLQRVICRLRDRGFDNIVVNVHHFSEQVVDFLETHDFGVKVTVSDESARLLDTGGALLKALPMFPDGEPVLVHNVDILSDAPLREIMERHYQGNTQVSLVTSQRTSSRKLIFNSEGRLCGWTDIASGRVRPEGFRMDDSAYHMASFSGIYVVSHDLVADLQKYSEKVNDCKFPIMDFLLDNTEAAAGGKPAIKIDEIELRELNLIDIGKPETLVQAESLLK